MKINNRLVQICTFLIAFLFAEIFCLAQEQTSFENAAATMTDHDLYQAASLGTLGNCSLSDQKIILL